MDDKVTLKPGTAMNPVPVVMVTCRDSDGTDNIMTVSWTGIVNSNPPMTYISVQPARYSHHIIEKTGEFVINLTNKQLAAAADFCGTHSGKDTDKFEALSLGRLPADTVQCSVIAESPVSLECRVVETHRFPSHDMFVAEITAVRADSRFVSENGTVHLEEAGLIAYSDRQYYALQPHAIGAYGYTMSKR